MSAAASPSAVGGRPAHFAIGPLARLPYPLRNVLRRWRGLVGMIVGVGLALGIGMTMLAVSRATTELLTGDYRISQADLYVVTHGGRVVPVLPGDSPGTIRQGRQLLTRIRGLPHVNAAVGVMSWSLEREQEGPRRRDEPGELVGTMGIDGDPAEVPGLLLLKEGRWPRRTDEVLLGARLAREEGLGLGDTMRLGRRDFAVVGIGRLRGFGLGGDALAYVDSGVLSQRADIGDQLNVIAIDTARPAETRERVAELESVAAHTPADVNRQTEEFAASAMTLRGIFNVLTLTIAGLFVSNMLGRSVTERRQEFATLRAIGIPAHTVLAAVAGEALLVNAVASLLGVGISLGLGALIDGYIAPAYGIESLYYADAALFGLVFALAIVLGLVAGFRPARRATRVDPVEVLREA
jgi:ABC-type lipoprotein release transport system permease subunit